MKIMQGVPLRLAVCFILLLAASPQIIRRAHAADMRLTSECVSNKFSLHWYGAPGFVLQQTTNLASPIWQDVPGSKGMSFCELPMTNPMAFFRVANIDAFTDVDADGLDDSWETNGWEIVIDAHGYGSDGLVTRQVTSDPSKADSDGDGIEDFWEWLLGTDPRATDTDGDGLSDYDEWFKWLTSPTSVDTDGDARGRNHNLPPKAQLFDGNELSLLHTSPTLEDTDGDGRTDYEEYDQLGRNPLVAQLPDVIVELVDAMDIRLDVQYAEEIGQTHEYGGELTTSDTTGQETSDALTKSWSVEAGAEYKFGLDGGLTLSVKGTYGRSSCHTFTTSSSKTVQSSSSDYNTDSRTRTETAASGSMSAGIRLVNTGPVTYTLTDLGLTVRYWASGTGTNQTFKTLATLVPALGANGITLAPGDSTPVLQVQANGLNASRVKEFMARPNSVYIEPAFYELENAEALNFDFLEEVTRWRTARVEIDYGDGTNEQYRVATNVERNDDGNYTGVTMGNVMSNILHIPFQATNIQALVPTNATNQRVLYSVRARGTTSITNGFWVVGRSGAGAAQTHTNFENIVLHAGDEILLTFIRDDDGDGLFAPEEQHYRTDEGPLGTTSDSDGDGLLDVFEARTGWDVNVTNRSSYHVYSDPIQADQDGDGLTDAEEFAKRTDPTKADTDDDGVSDRYDLFPLVPAKVLRVKVDATGLNNGSSWANALTNLQDALTLARNGLATTSNSSDDVAEIWVAAGVYRPTTTTNRNISFELVNNTALYGGFIGVETKLSQRDPSPLSNDTILSGDLLGNDASTPWDNPASFTNDNSYAVCSASSVVGSGSILNGFTITGGSASGYGGGLFSLGRPTVKNLFFRANYGLNGAGLHVWLHPATAEPYVISDCLFLQNGAGGGGAGGILLLGDPAAPTAQVFTVTNCHFYENAGTGDGGGLVVGRGTFEINNCTFAWNTTSGRGGGMEILRPAAARISRCEFIGNSATAGGAGLFMSDFSSEAGGLKAEVLQTVFWGNSTPGYGGAIWAGTANLPDKRLYLLNSTVVSNTATAGGGNITMDYGAGWIENSILWGSTNRLFGGSTLVVRTTCLPEAGSYPGNGNINSDPKFVDSFGGNLRLQSSSPCIDRGNNYLDYHPTIPGWQPLPDADVDGNWRIMDGNNDGYFKVDMGAYERQGM